MFKHLEEKPEDEKALKKLIYEKVKIILNSYE